MIKKKYIFYALLFVLLSPLSVKAYGISCPQGNYKKGDTFTCTITSEDTYVFDKLRATIESPDALSCKLALVGPGLNPTESNNDNLLDVTGANQSAKIADIACDVIENVENNTIATLVINDFTYTYTLSNNEKTEVLRSNSITIDHLETEEDINNKKPRTTSNPDSRIKGITDPNLSYTFSQFVTEYYVSVLYEVTNLNLQVTPNNVDAQVRIEGSQELAVGQNTIDVYATSPDGSSITCYTLYVKRLKEGEAIYNEEADAELESLRIKGHTINYKKEVLEYNVHVTSDVTMLSIDAKAKAQNAKVDITNNSNIQNGTVIAVTVTSMDGTQTSVYKINVTKDAPKKNYKTVIIITLAVLGIAGVVTIFILTNNKKKMNDPLLKLKFLKRKINKGKNFDDSVVPEAEANSVIENQNVTEQPVVQQDNQIATNTTEVVAQPVAQAQVVQPVVQPSTPEAPAQPTIAQPVTPVVPVQQVAPVQPVVQPTPVVPVQPIQPVQPQPTQQVNQGVYVQPIQQPLSATQQIPVQQIVNASNNAVAQTPVSQPQVVQVPVENQNIFNTIPIQSQQIVSQLQQSDSDTSKQ